MRVCFITPPSLFLLDERVFPALGILKVAAVAEQLGHDVEHLDLNGVKDYVDTVRQYCSGVSRTTTIAFAISATTPQMVAATKIRNEIVQQLPLARIIIGGPHATLTHAAFLAGSERAKEPMSRLLADYDFVVAGDGEKAIETALQLKYVAGLINADDPKDRDLWLSSRELEQLPLPARHLIDLDSYHYMIDGERATPLIAQLGCPFGCYFCAGRDSAMLRRVRLRSSDHIVAEMRYIYERYGIKGFMFFDDELNVNTRLIELLEKITRLQHELGVSFKCRGFIKAELFTSEQAMWMYSAGFTDLLCGFESGSDRILRNINKHATKDDNTRAIALAYQFGLRIKALMSIGHPGESMKTVRDTEEWLLAVAPHDMDATIITAYPGSPYYDKAVHVANNTWKFEVNGDCLYQYDIDYTQVEDFYKGAVDGYRSYVFTDHLTPHDLVALRNDVEHSVRRGLNIPYPQARASVVFDASMGALPGMVYRRSE